MAPPGAQPPRNDQTDPARHLHRLARMLRPRPVAEAEHLRHRVEVEAVHPRQPGGAETEREEHYDAQEPGSIDKRQVGCYRLSDAF